MRVGDRSAFINQSSSFNQISMKDVKVKQELEEQIEEMAKVTHEQAMKINQLEKFNQLVEDKLAETLTS